MTRVLIDIPDEDFSLLCEAFGEVELKSTLNLRLQSAVAHGTVLPKGHGDLIDANALKQWVDDSISQYGNRYSTDMLNMFGLFKEIVENAPIVIAKENGND